MQLSPGGPIRGGSAPLITALTLVILGAMAFAIPPSRLQIRNSGVERGFLLLHSSFGPVRAAQLAQDGYSFLAIDLTNAGVGEKEHWRTSLHQVAELQFPVWGWLDLTRGNRMADRIAQGTTVAGLFLHGPGAVALAARLRRKNPALRFLPVLRSSDPTPGGGAEYAVAMPYDEFIASASRTKYPVLIADRLDRERIERARTKAGDHYLIAKGTATVWK